MLLEIGFNLVLFLMVVFYLFREVEVEVFCVLFFNVMDFYKLFDKIDFLCNVGLIFCYVSKMLFKN